MIHPSTMAGPNWFTGSFGTTNPFQQNSSSFFRNMPFQGPQGGFGFGNNPFQGSQGGFGFGNNPFQNPTFGFGTNTAQIQNAINEIVRQTVPTIVAGYGFQPTTGFQTPTGAGNIGGTPTGNWSTGPQFPNTPFGGNILANDWQTQNLVAELVRQTTNQALQNLSQFGFGGSYPGQTGGYNPNFGTNPQQQYLWNLCGQICQQACQWVCQTTCQAIVTCAIACLNQTNTMFNTGTPFTTGAQQNVLNACVQICQQACQQLCQTVVQSVVTCATACLNAQNTPFNYNTQNTPFFNTQNTPFFNTQNTPFNVNNTAPQYGFTPGIPTGAGAF